MIHGNTYNDVAILEKPEAPSSILLVCEHASNHIPSVYGTLGLSDGTRSSHVAWDPGALGVALDLSDALRAPLIHCGVSRLIYDCNRPPSAESAMPERSELYDIPGNQGLSAAEKQARIDAIYTPFHDAVANQMTAMDDLQLLVTIHSFTPTYQGKAREVEVGLLHGTDDRFAKAMLGAKPAGFDLNTQLNEPYSAADGVAHMLDRHGSANGLLNVMIEVRNDLIATPDQQKHMAKRFAPWLSDVLAAYQEVGAA